MKTWGEEFGEAIDSLDPEARARLEAAFRGEASASDTTLDDNPWCCRGDDPFGMGWAWCDPPKDDAGTAATSSQSHEVTTADNPSVMKLPDRGGRRSYIRVVGYAAAACLLIAFGSFIGSTISRDGIVVLVATVTPTFSPGRGGQEKWLGVKVESDLSGFVTIVALAPGRRPETIPSLGGDDEPVSPSTPAEIGPLPSSTTNALIIITQTPSGEPIRKALREKMFEPDQQDELKAFLRATLESKGYHRLAFGSTTFDKK